MRAWLRKGVVAVLFCIGFCLPVVLLAAGKDKQPWQVLTAVNQSSIYLVGIAKYMGLQPKTCSHYLVTKASPREVYFQALRFYDKVGLLYNEITANQRTKTIFPQVDEKKLSPSDVYVVVEATNKTLLDIFRYLKIKSTKNVVKAPRETTPSKVYQQLLLENQFVDALLEKPVSLSNIFEVATLSVYYAGSIIDAMPNVLPVVQEPSLQNNKTLNDVFEQQVKIIHKLQLISQLFGLNMLSLKFNFCAQSITINHLQELSYIILSELAYIANVKGVSVSQLKSYYPGKKYPSDVYQRNIMLLDQLDEIATFAKSHPKWIKSKAYDK